MGRRSWEVPYTVFADNRLQTRCSIQQEEEWREHGVQRVLKVLRSGVSSMQNEKKWDARCNPFFLNVFGHDGNLIEITSNYTI